LASALIGRWRSSLRGLSRRTGSSLSRATWWLGDLSGALIVVPLALAWLRPAPATRHSIRSAAALGVLVFVIACAWLSTQGGGLTYLAFPPCCSLRAATAARAQRSPSRSWPGSRSGDDPRSRSVFVRIDHHGVVETQLFIVVSSISTLSSWPWWRNARVPPTS